MSRDAIRNTSATTATAGRRCCGSAASGSRLVPRRLPSRKRFRRRRGVREYLWWPSRATTHAPEGPDNGDGLRMLKRFFSYYRPYRTLFLLDFSCAVVAGLLELGFPMAVKAFIDHLLPGQDWELILLASAGLLAVYLVNTGLRSEARRVGKTCARTCRSGWSPLH